MVSTHRYKEISKEKYNEYKKRGVICDSSHLNFHMLDEIIQLKKPKSGTLYKTYGKVSDQDNDSIIYYYDMGYSENLQNKNTNGKIILK